MVINGHFDAPLFGLSHQLKSFAVMISLTALFRALNRSFSNSIMEKSQQIMLWKYCCFSHHVELTFLSNQSVFCFYLRYLPQVQIPSRFSIFSILNTKISYLLFAIYLSISPFSSQKF